MRVAKAGEAGRLAGVVNNAAFRVCVISELYPRFRLELA